MPLSMKIQPIDAHAEASEGLTRPETPIKPVMMKSRLKRLLFRISANDKAGTDDNQPPLAVNKDGFGGGGGGGGGGTGGDIEPSSVCLAKMVQNFIEESNEKQSVPAAKCGRRCNCFNGNGSDSSDSETENISGADVCDFLKSLAVCASVNERNVLAETAKIIEKNSRTCKRKDELRKVVSDGLVGLGYDASTCISKWDKSPSFPAGEYEYVDVVIEGGGERLIIDVDFRSEFEIARSTKTYKSVLQIVPHIFVGKFDRLSKIITIVSEAAKQSLKKKGMPCPPWRKAEYVKAKWLSPNHIRARPVISVPSPLAAPPLPPSPPAQPQPLPPPVPPPVTVVRTANIKSSGEVEAEEDQDSSFILINDVSSEDVDTVEKSPAVMVKKTIFQLGDSESDSSDESSAGTPRPEESESVFVLSERSGEEDVKVSSAKEKVQLEVMKKQSQAVEVVVRNPKKSVSGINGISASSTGLASIMDDYP